MTLAETSAAAPAPELGKLVALRGRHWVVSEVLRSSLAPDPLASPSEPPQHLVSLTSVDDGPAAEVTVIWEVEPGARVLPQKTLPVPRAGSFDDPSRLDAFLAAVRWGAITSADSHALQAPFRSGITIEEYQLDPVVRALSMPRVNLGIFDDVGLGKTIEAGLVIEEMLLRHRARTVLVVCPASLCIKWQSEMAGKFGLEFRIVDSELIRTLRRDRGIAANPWKHFPRLIVSLQWLRGPRAMALMREALPPTPTYPRAFDLLVIDEAHNVAPPGRRRYITDSLQTKAIREIAPHFEHRMFLTATPHNGYTASFTALLEMLDPQRFARGVRPNPEALRQVMVRRLKSELRNDPDLRRPDGSPRFPKRTIRALTVDYPEEEVEVHESFRAYTQSRRSAASKSNNSARDAADFVTLLLKKRMFSSPAALAQTLATHRATLERQAEQRRHTSRTTDTRALRSAFDRIEDDVDNDDDVGRATEEALATAAHAGDDGLTAAQRDLLDRMQNWAEGARYRPDAKAAALLEFLDATCRPDGSWNDERVIVFTEYRDTQLYLHNLLAQHMPGNDITDRVALLYGGMDEKDRERIKEEFQRDPSLRKVRILLATDAASEGIDLQNHCFRLVHYDTPFSITRMEQRNGRIDRHGQRAPEVLIHHFVGAGWEDASPGSLQDDLHFLVLLARRLETVREDLDTYNPLLSDAVHRRMLGDTAATVDGEPLDAKRSPAAKLLGLERRLRDDLRKLAATLDESRSELGIDPETVEQVVAVALELARQPPLQPVTLDRDNGNAKAFAVGDLTGGWARTILELPDPLNGERRPITFDQATADGHDDVVLAHLNHPLVAQSTRLLRAYVWAGDDADLHRVTARVVPDDQLGEVVAIIHARLVITGRQGRVLHEEVVAAGGRIANGRFNREGYGVQRIRELRAAATDEAVPRHIAEALADVWPQVSEAAAGAIANRTGDRADGLTVKVAEKAEADVAAMRATLTDLRRTILEEIEEIARPEQLSLFDADERLQLDRDVEALRNRAEQIPDEIEHEEVAIRGRYDDPRVWMFPAAIEFLVPLRICEHGVSAATGKSSDASA